MVRRVLLVLALATAAAVTAPSSAMARTLVVGTGPGCSDGRFASIQAALDVTRPGDQVAVCPGTYRENVRVRTDRVKLYSRKRRAAVIQMPGGTHPIVGLSGRAVVLRGFTITGVPPAAGCGADANAVEVFGTGLVEDNRILDLGCDSITNGIDNRFSLGPERFTIERNEISGFTGAGVAVRGLPTVVVNRNVIRGGRTGVGFADGRLGSAGYGVIQSNTIEDAEFGIGANGLESESFRLVVRGNRLRRNGYGIHISQVGQGVGSDQTRSTRIEGNGVFDSVHDGISIDDGLGFVFRNRVLGSGRFDCFDPDPVPRARPWKGNIGVTDSPSNLCRAP